MTRSEVVAATGRRCASVRTLRAHATSSDSGVAPGADQSVAGVTLWSAGSRKSASSITPFSFSVILPVDRNCPRASSARFRIDVVSRSTSS